MASKMDELERRGYKGYNEEGQQMVDPTPVRLPVGFKHVDNFANRVREIVRGEQLRAEAEAAQMETFEEADDFDIPDDPIDPSTPYEADFDVPSPAELRAQAKREAKEKARDNRRVDGDKGSKGERKEVARKAEARDGDVGDVLDE